MIYYLLQLALISSYTMVLQVRFPWMASWFGLYALIWAGVVVGLRGFLTVMAGLLLLWWNPVNCRTDSCPRGPGGKA